MKKIIYLIALCNLFAACDKTQDEDLMEGIFIGSSSQKNKLLTEYESMVSIATDRKSTRLNSSH